ncbi:hypothetical protein EYF88_02750 [Paracoccus sediminis]|uniref:Mu-like prophage I protein n=2 Tax=Paracoccus sediminis TaxID=1214787 RepID=A0A238ULR4_9RHOB|nr:hypothetical protein EYF88_02750 [Paracoccus sediminis]SNR22911.1 Mu-like prophage I protein [Paracoccus sediminis]
MIGMARRSSTLQGIALNAQDGTAPDWVQLIPAGPRILGRDGRRWKLSDPAAVAAAFNASIQKPHIDIEHSTQIRAPKGEPAPAVGWFEEIESRDGSIWGRMDWTEEGRVAVASRAYRYLSPAFRHDPRSGEVLAIVSAGLTNNPNLDMAALNAAEQETDEMLDPALLEALGLNANASAADAVVAIGKLKDTRDTALNAAKMPDPDKFVPRADHDLALNRIAGFETAEKTRRDEAINSALDAAVAAGKVAPASREYHLAACRSDGGLERFQAAMATAPVIAAGSGIDARKPGDAAGPTDEQVAVCRAMNMDPAVVFGAGKKE